MNEVRSFFEKNKTQILETFQGKMSLDEPMSRHTYYQTGGNADYFFCPKTESDLKWISEFSLKFNLPIFVMGLGSNLLVSDEGFRGIVVKTSQLENLIEENSDSVHLGAGIPIVKLLRTAGEKNWAGFERLGGIPGSIGGACFMNAGTHLGETKDILISVEGYQFKPIFKKLSFSGEDLKYSYRKNSYLPKDFVLTKTLWKKQLGENQKKLIQEVIERRKKTQPVDMPSCGSVFKNPLESGYRSWQVIEKIGLRGFRCGDAQFSEKHSNFIVNHGKAKSQDIFDLIQLAKSKAKKELNVELNEEVRYLGFSSKVDA